MAETNNETDTGDKGQDSELQKKLTESNTRVAEAEVLAKLMRDPDFAALYSAKTGGRPVKVVFADEKQAHPPEGQQGETQQPPPNLEEMNELQKAQYIVDQVSKKVAPMIDERLKPLGEKLSGLERFSQESMNEEARRHVSTGREKY